MKLNNFFLPIVLFALFFAGCNNNNNNKAAEKQSQKEEKSDAKSEPAVSDFVAPQFTDPELNKFYATYTDYLKRVVTSIRKKDEAGTMALFTNEGKQFDGKNDIDAKAKEAEPDKFRAWIMQAAPYQREIVQSPYYKKFSEEYYKKVKENFEKKY